MTEHRRGQRLRTFKGGSIIFGLVAPVNCTIRNMSATGAALEVETQVGIPAEFVLLIRPECIRRKCRVAWRSDNDPGGRLRVDLAPRAPGQVMFDELTRGPA